MAGGSVFACGRVLLLMHTIPVTSANSLLGRASHVVKRAVVGVLELA